MFPTAPRGDLTAPAGDLLRLAVSVVLAFIALGSLSRIGLIFFNADGALFQPHRTAIAKQDITHENVWGVADEDLFGQTLREIDARIAVGRIDLPSGSGRDGAVKYND